MSRRNSSNWAVNDAITAARLHDLNEDLDDLYAYGSDRGRVWSAISGTALRIDIAAFAWRVGSTSGQYAGGTDIVVTNTATNYVEIDSTGTIAINTTGWTAANARLATVTCSGGVITAISIWKVDAIGGTLGSSTTVANETLSGSRTLISTDEYYQALNPNGADRTVTLDTANMADGNAFWVKNTSTANVLNVKQSSTLIAVVYPGEAAHFAYDGTNWATFRYVPKDQEIFGDGSDGDVTISSNTTLTRDMFYNNLTISDTFALSPNGFRVYVKQTLTLSGTGNRIKAIGGNGGNGASGAAGSAGGTAGSAANTAGSLPASLGGKAGSNGKTGGAGAGTAGVAGDASAFGLGAAGAAGGNGLNDTPLGGAGGALTVQAYAKSIHKLLTFGDWNSTTFTRFTGHGGSGSGAGGDAGSSGNGGGGGGSGGNGGFLWIAARTITGTGDISVAGGTGGNGGDASGNSGGAGGGAGGGGGILVILYGVALGWTGSAVYTGGTGGTGGVDTGSDGKPGTNGTTGKYYFFCVA